MIKSKRAKRSKLQQIRTKYSLKRRSKKFKKRRRNHTNVISTAQKEKYRRKKYRTEETLVAPENFSFIENTNEVLKYFNNAFDLVKKKSKIYYDVSAIKNLTPDTITLLSAHFGDKLCRKYGFGGNAPNNHRLQKIFTESGLYDHVNSISKKNVSPKNRLWKHSSNNEVKGRMAGEAKELCKKSLSDECFKNVSDHLYNLIVEAMSNTIHHAEPNKQFIANWWLFGYIDENITKYCFIDLGVGIFKSANFNKFRKAFSHIYKGNQHLVEPFLNGDIISSRKLDNEISGKGVKQIVNCATIPEFKTLYIITNDLKINVKTKKSELLDENFNGTCIYWEIENV